MFDKAITRLPNIYKLMGLLVGLDVLQAIFIIGQAYNLSATITGLWYGNPLKKEILNLSLFVMCYIFRQVIDYLKAKKLKNYALKQSEILRKDFLNKIFKLGPKVVQKYGSGNVITMTLDGIEKFENYIQLILTKMIDLMIIPWMILVMIFKLDWQSGLALLLVYPIVIIFMIILGYAAKSKADRQYNTFQMLSNHFLDSLRGIDTLKYFGLSKRYAKSIYQTSESFRKATMSTLKIAILSTFALDFFTTMSIAVVAVLLGLRLLNGAIVLFPALTILILAPEYFLPIRNFANDYHATLDGKNAYQAISKILNEKQTSTKQIEIANWNEKSSLEMTDISVCYDKKLALEVSQIKVKGYQKIGIVGASGSGKTTFVNLLSGFLTKKNGSIKIDGNNSFDFKQKDWQKQILYIPQDPYIFDATLYENLTFYTPHATKEEVLEILKIVGLDKLVSELKDGINTKIGNGNRQLSGGQAQRIALGRALLDKERKILIFDEPSAHLDIETEVELKEKMLPIMENRLVFFATHRLHWLAKMDLVIVLDKGKVVEFGEYQELLAKKAYLYRLKNKMGGF